LFSLETTVRGGRKDNSADVINVAVQALVENRCELPGYATLVLVVGDSRPVLRWVG
jgi:hypothetical protein